ncbi:YgdI/YgdR family lipoprotein [[Ruminococcus] torques]|nr:YgdI/YgdR family lipoprotein [[Ruminococcus] torques]MCG4501184.1 YgdI/YgdR family lipoprotein [[Ruminococcus] torques]
MMKKKMLAVAVCVSMCMMAFAGCTSEQIIVVQAGQQ